MKLAHCTADDCTTIGVVIGKRCRHVKLSQVMTLEPGDLIATGTCAGVDIGSGRFLQPGDVVKVQIDGLGHFENRVKAEPAGLMLCTNHEYI